MDSVADIGNSEHPEPVVRVTGQIKWFDPAKGFGFVVADPAEGVIPRSDIMLHVSCLRAYGEMTADEGARITCNVAHRERGWQVVEVLEMDRPRASLIQDQGEAVVFEAAIVKWFNASKGFGFVNRPNSDQDIFIHISVMRQFGVDMLQTGEQVLIVSGQGQKGESVLILKKPH